MSKQQTRPIYRADYLEAALIAKLGYFAKYIAPGSTGSSLAAAIRMADIRKYGNLNADPKIVNDDPNSLISAFQAAGISIDEFASRYSVVASQELGTFQGVALKLVNTDIIRFGLAGVDPAFSYKFPDKISFELIDEVISTEVFSYNVQESSMAVNFFHGVFEQNPNSYFDLFADSKGAQNAVVIAARLSLDGHGSKLGAVVNFNPYGFEKNVIFPDSARIIGEAIRLGNAGKIVNIANNDDFVQLINKKFGNILFGHVVQNPGDFSLLWENNTAVPGHLLNNTIRRLSNLRFNIDPIFPDSKPHPGHISVGPLVPGVDTENGGEYLDEITVIGRRESSSSDLTIFLYRPASETLAFQRGALEGRGEDEFIRVEGIGAIGSVFGSTLGQRLAPNNQLEATIASVGIGAIGSIFAEGIANKIEGATISQVIQDSVAALPSEILQGTVGAVSSFLVAELINALGLDGFAEGLAFTGVNAIVGQIAQNLLQIAANVPGVGVFTGVFNTFNIANAFGSFLGTKIGQALVNFDTIGGQIGSSLGAAAAPIAVNLALRTIGLTLTPLGFLVTTLVGYLLGGLIGSLFGGTPRSRADVVWDERDGLFEAANVYARKGGSRGAALSLAEQVAGAYNSIIESTGGKLLDGNSVRAGTYGLYKSQYSYSRDYSPKFDTANELINYGTFFGISDIVNRIAGGDVFIKRALTSTVEVSQDNIQDLSGEFSLDTVVGNISTAQQYRNYLQNSTAIDALIAQEPDSAFTVSWLVTLQHALELGLNKRASSDWTGGWDAFLDEIRDDKVDGVGYLPTQLAADFNAATGERNVFVSDENGNLLGIVGDTIEAADQTFIDGTAGADTIDLRGESVDLANGLTSRDQDTVAIAGADFTALSDFGSSFVSTSRRATVSVLVAADDAAEGNERFALDIATASGYQIIGPQDGGSATVTIVDGASDLPTLLVGRAFVAESTTVDNTAIVRLSLSKASSEAVTVALALQNGTALGGSVDYGATGAGNLQVSVNGVWTDATSATFAAGQTEILVRTPIKRDAANVAEGKETFSLVATLDAANGAKVANGATSVSGLVTIIDARDAGTRPYIWIDDAVVDEASGTANVTVSRSGTANVDTAFIVSTRALTERITIGVAAVVDAGDGDDTVHASDLGDTLQGGAGNDTLYGGRLDDWLLGGDGNDTLNAGSAAGDSLGGNGNYLDGGAGDDWLIGREGSDWLAGGEGNDTLDGGDGGDILDAGAGLDTSYGGLGDDQYLFARGDGVDQASDDSQLSVTELEDRYGVAAGTLANGTAFNGTGLGNWRGGGVQIQSGQITGGEDAIVFGPGITIEDISLQRSGDDLVITLRQNGVATSDVLTLKDWTNPFNRVEILRFADGNELRIADFDTFVLGTDANEVLIGTNGNDFVYGGGGNDLIYLLSGNDFGNGGIGNDVVSGDAGSDIVVGSDGDDTVLGGTGNDTVSGGRGDDAVQGQSGNDIVSGGQGRDEVIGGAGNDIFKFQRGDGQDTYIDALSGEGNIAGSSEWTLAWVSGDGFKDGFDWSGPDSRTITNGTTTIYDGSTWLVRTYYDIEQGRLYVHTPADADTYYENNGTDTVEFGIGIDINDVRIGSADSGKDIVIGIENAGGSRAAFQDLADRVTLVGAGAQEFGTFEKISFFNTGTIDLGAFNLSGGTDGDDTAAQFTVDNSKRNWLTGGIGNDTIIGGSKDDILNGNAGQDRLDGAAGDDVLLGGADDDTLIGGAGADTLIGGEGYDTASYATSTAGVFATLGSDTQGNVTGDAFGDVYDSIEALEGSSYADQLRGDENDNELTGGKDNDTLFGRQGDDTYVFGRGDGQDTINEESVIEYDYIVKNGGLSEGYTSKLQLVDQDSYTYTYEHIVQNQNDEIIYRYQFVSPARNPDTPSFEEEGWLDNANGTPMVQPNGDVAYENAADVDGGSDTIVFADYTGNPGYGGEQAIGLSNLNFAFAGNDLIISLKGATDKITIIDFRSGAQINTNKAIEFLQFTGGLSVDLSRLRFDDSGNFLTTATELDDVILGADDAANTLNGGAGNDTLIGDASNDTLAGGAGDDVLIGGDGGDTFIGDEGQDQVVYDGSGAGVTVNLSTQTASQTLQFASGGEASGDRFDSIESVVGSNYDDAITGTDENNVLKGNRGADTLSGLGGDDALAGDEGNDILHGGGGDDALDGGDGADQLLGDAGDDSLTGGTGNDDLLGGEGEDNLLGDDGTDTLSGDAGDDFLAGGRGDDLLKGGAGADVYSLRAGDGHDRIETGDTVEGGIGHDEILFDGIPSTALQFTRTATNDLLITAVGYDAAVTVTGWFAGVANQARRITASNAALSRFDINALLTAAGGADLTALAAAWQALDAYEDHATLVGTSGADTLTVDPIWVGGTRLDGLNGNDTLTGGAADDTLIGGVGDDRLSGGAGDDTFVYAKDAGFDTVDGGDGDDTLLSTTADGEIRLRSLQNVERIEARAPTSDQAIPKVNVYLESGQSIDLTNVELIDIHQILGESGAEIIAGSAGNDYIVGLSGNDTLNGGSGDDIISDGAGIDLSDGGDGIDTIDVSENNVAITVDLEAQRINYGSNTEVILNFENATGTSLDDTLRGDVGANTLLGGSGNDSLFGSGGDDVLIGDIGNDNLNGGDGDDILIGGAGADALDGGSGVDTASYQNAASGVRADLSNVGSLGDANGDTYVGIENIFGSNFNDTLQGNSNANELFGGAGNDTLFGWQGQDTLIGGAGNDLIYGNTFNEDDYTQDTFLYYGSRSGYQIGIYNERTKSVTITDIDASDGDDGEDTLYIGSNDRIVFSDFEYNVGVTPNVAPQLGLPGPSNQSIDDNVVKTFTLPATSFFDQDLEDKLTVTATLDDDTVLPSWLTFDPATWTFEARPRDIDGFDANDPKFAGQNWEIKVTATDLQRASVSTTFTLTLTEGELYVQGTNTADSWVGVRRRQRFDGGGQPIGAFDTISYAASSAAVSINLQSTNTIKVGSLDYGQGSGGDAQGDLYNSIEKFIGSAFNDTLIGDGLVNVLEGGDGDDTLDGEAGGDNLYGGAGADILRGGAGDDVIFARATADFNEGYGDNSEDSIDGGDGFDTLYFSESAFFVRIDLSENSVKASSIENITGSDYHDYITGNNSANRISGGLGNDTIGGGGGNDWLEGGAGHNTIKGGDGQDQIFGGNDGNELYGGTGNDIIFGGAGNDVLDGGAGADTLDGGDGSDEVDYRSSDAGISFDLGKNYTGSGGFAQGDTLENFEIVQASNYDDSLIADLIGRTFYGNGGNDTLIGGIGADIFYGGDGNDTLIGGIGADIFYGGDGNDNLKGENGDDTLFGGAGDDQLDGGSGADSIRGDAGDDTVIITDWTEDTLVDGGDDSDTLNLTGVAGLVTLDLGNDSRFLNFENVMAGDGGAVLTGTAAANRLEGGAGDDTLSGGAGSDKLFGRDGYDILSGGSGNDTLEGGDGNDILYGGSDADVLRGGAGIDLADFSGSSSGTGFSRNQIGRVDVGGQTVVAAVDVNLSGVNVSLETGVGANADAAGDSYAEIEDITGSSYGDLLEGDNGNNVIHGGAGGDILYGGDGNDTLFGDTDDDLLFGGDGQDSLYGGDGDDRLFGEGESDTLFGGNGNDVLEAGDAGDTLDGGTGNDILIGGQGGDGYMIYRTSGNDTIYNYDTDSGRDTIIYDSATINYRDLWFEKVGKDLVVSVLDRSASRTDTATTIKDWFTNSTPDNYDAADNFYVNTLVSDRSEARQVDVNKLLSVTSAIVNRYSLTPEQWAMLDNSWGINEEPTLTPSVANATSITEGQELKIVFSVDDVETSDAVITLSILELGGAKFQPVSASDIVIGSPTDRYNEKLRTVTLRTQADVRGTATLSVRSYDGGLYSAPQNFTFNIVPVAKIPNLSVGASVVGNINTAIALPVITASKVDQGETLTLYLEGLPSGATLSDGVRSAINPSIDITGWNWAALRVTPATNNAGDFTLTVRARSSETASIFADATQAVSVTVNGGPTGVSLTPTAAHPNEDTVYGSDVVLGTLAAVGDPDSAGTGNYSFNILGGDDYAKFAINGASLVLKAGQTLDYDRANGYALTIQVNDNGLTASHVVTVDRGFLNPVDEAPSAPLYSTANQITENAAGRSAVSGLTLSAVDPEGGAVTYEIAYASTTGLFEISGNQVVVKSGATLDYETIPSVVLDIQAKDSAGHTSTATRFTIGVNNVDEAPINETNTEGLTVDEAVSGSFSKALSATDPDGHAITWVFDSNPGEIFRIDGNNLKLTGALDYENLPVAAFGVTRGTRGSTVSTTVKLHAVANGLSSAVSTLTFTLQDTDERLNPVIASTPVPVAENTTGTTIAALSGGSDPDGDPQEIDYFFVTGYDPGGLLRIDQTATGANLVVNKAFDYENAGLYSTDAGGRYVNAIVVAKQPGNQDSNTNISDQTTIKVYVTNVNDNAPTTPSVTSEGSTSTNENNVALHIATLSSSDADGNPVSYSISQNSQWFEILKGNEVWAKAGLDYENGGGERTVGVRASDGTFSSGEWTTTFTVNNVDDNTPVAGGIAFKSGYSSTIVENSLTVGTVIATASASDADGDAITYSLKSNPGGAFAINASSGEISIAKGIDYEGLGGSSNPGVDPDISITLTVRAAQTNNSGRGIDQNLSINVKDLVEVDNLNPIFNGNINLLNYNTLSTLYVIDPQYFASRYGLQVSYVYNQRTSETKLSYKLFYDSNGNNLFDVGDITLASKVKINGIFDPLKDELKAGYRWEGAEWSSRFLRELPPIVLDLDNTGIRPTQAQVSFDVDGDGVKDQVGWISGGQAFLALDRNGDGVIDKGAEISFLQDLPGARTDLEGLRAYDSNGDGLFNDRDERFGEFLVWQDANEDGVSDAGELKSLADAGIASIDFGNVEGVGPGEDDDKQVIFGITRFTRTDGTTGQVGDVALRWSSGDPAPGDAAQALDLPAATAIPVAQATVQPVPPLDLPAGYHLVIDANGDGAYRDGEDLRTQAALSAYDSDGDGILSAADTRFRELRFWTDSNGDGFKAPVETRLPEQLGLPAVSITALLAQFARDDTPAAESAPVGTAPPQEAAAPIVGDTFDTTLQEDLALDPREAWQRTALGGRPSGSVAPVGGQTTAQESRTVVPDPFTPNYDDLDRRLSSFAGTGVDADELEDLQSPAPTARPLSDEERQRQSDGAQQGQAADASDPAEQSGQAVQRPAVTPLPLGDPLDRAIRLLADTQSDDRRALFSGALGVRPQQAARQTLNGAPYQQLDRLIAAMASLQSGAGAQIQAEAQLARTDAMIAQLAPSV